MARYEVSLLGCEELPGRMSLHEETSPKIEDSADKHYLVGRVRMMIATAMSVVVHSTLFHLCFQMDLFHCWMNRVVAVPEVVLKNYPSRTAVMVTA